MRSFLLSCAALCVSRLAYCLPSAQIVLPDPPHPCSVPDTRPLGNDGVARPSLMGKCLRKELCPDDKLHFGTPNDCARLIQGGVCCINEVVACAGKTAGTCRNDITHFSNANFVSSCPKANFLPMDANSADICPSGKSGDGSNIPTRCCVPVIDAPGELPLPNTGLLPNADFLSPFQPQEIPSNLIGGTGFNPQQSVDQQANVPASYGNTLLSYANFLRIDNSQPPQLQATGLGEFYPL